MGNDPLYESASGLGPLREDADINCLGTAYLDDGYLRIAYNDQPAPEPDWDEVERNALAAI